MGGWLTNSIIIYSVSEWRALTSVIITSPGSSEYSLYITLMSSPSVHFREDKGAFKE